MILSDLPDDLIVLMLVYLAPPRFVAVHQKQKQKQGENKAAAAAQKLTSVSSSGDDGGGGADSSTSTFFSGNALATGQTNISATNFRIWPRQALLIGLTCRAFHRVIFEKQEYDSLLWSGLAAHFRDTLLSSVIDETGWITANIDMDPSKPGIINKSAIHVSAQQVPAQALALLTSGTTKKPYRYRLASKDFVEARRQVMKRLQHREKTRAFIYRSEQIYESKYVKVPLLSISFFIMYVLLCASCVLLTVQKALEWRWSEAPRPPEYISITNILRHVGFAPLLLASVFLLFLSILILWKPIVRNILRRDLPPLIARCLLVAVAFVALIFVLMIYLNNCVISGAIPWPVVFAPIYIPFLVSMFVFAMIFSTTFVVCLARRRRYAIGEDLVWSSFCVILSLLVFAHFVLISITLQLQKSAGIQLHVVYSFIPAFIALILYSISMCGDVLVRCFKQPKGIGFKTCPMDRPHLRDFLMSFLLPPSLLLYYIISCVWNSYALLVPAILPLTVLLVVCIVEFVHVKPPDYIPSEWNIN